MYLIATKRVDKVNWKVLNPANGISLDSPEAISQDFTDLMQLTQLTDVATDIYGASVEVTCAYWRKANSIHGWFVNNVQDCNDNCGRYSVSTEQLQELLALCQKSLNEKDPSLLMPVNGPFFGGGDIDQWYWEDIKETIEKLNRIVALPDFNELSFHYESSW